MGAQAAPRSALDSAVLLEEAARVATRGRKSQLQSHFWDNPPAEKRARPVSEEDSRLGGALAQAGRVFVYWE
jgi:hypothetical protein